MIIMRHLGLLTIPAFLMAVPWMMSGQPAAQAVLEIPNLTVGQGLQATAMVVPNGRVPREGLPITLTSDNPKLVLLSAVPHQAGSASIVLKVQPGSDENLFYVQALGKSGTTTYTATAPGFSPATGKVTLGPSGIVISGPFGVGKPYFVTTPRGDKPTVNVHPALLDSSLKYVATQALAGGSSIKVNITSSNAATGKILNPELSISGGTRGSTTLFQPGTSGETSLAVSAPAGFSTPAQFNAIIAKVLELTFVMDDIVIGKNLQSGANAGLVEPVGPGGLVITLTSNDPSQLLLSASSTEKGSNSLVIKLRAGESSASYYLQALGGSGKVTYTATAPGYRSRTAAVTLTPAGVILAGPASVMRSGANPGFFTSLGSKEKTSILIYTAYLDPVTHRSADITVQSLRAGIDLKIDLESSDPAVGKIDSPVVIKGGSDNVKTQFTPLKAGMTTLSVVTPAGYTASSNAASLKAIVAE